MEVETDILIVGGGLSGLALADTLEREGRDWFIVEARDRLGGRIVSPAIRDVRFDLGPTWFWRGQHRLEQLVHRFGLTVFEQYSEGSTVYQDSLGSVQVHRGLSLLQGYLRIAGGMERLIQVLGEELPKSRVLLGSPLESLEQTGNNIHAKAGGVTVRAGHVVLAVPPRVVAQTIRFEPALPKGTMEEMEAIPTWMAGQAKILAVYDRPYWREAGLSGDVISHRGPMTEIHDASPAEGGPYALFGFVGSPPDTRAQHPEQILEMSKHQLVTLFGPNMNEPLSLRMFDWAQEPQTATKDDRVTPRSHPLYGLPQKLQNIWSGAVLLGSTETAPQFGGFLEGALEAAELIHASL